jgi:hypothetical protein
MGAHFRGTSAGTWLPTFGSDQTFNAASTYSSYSSVAWDPHTAGRFAIAYKGQNNQGHAKIGTVSGTTVTWGSEYTFNSSVGGENYSIKWDPINANKVMVVYRDGANWQNGTGIIGTVTSTNVMTFGSKYLWTTNTAGSQVYYCRVEFDPNTSGSFVIVWKCGRGCPGGTGRVIAGWISGTTITYGIAVPYTATYRSHALAFDPNTAGKFAIAYKCGATSNHGRVVIGTVSGGPDAIVTLGTPVTYEASVIDYSDIAFDPNDSGKFVVVYRDTDYSQDNSGDNVKAIVGTRSGTSCTFGTAVNFGTDGAKGDINIDFDTAGGANGKCLIWYTQVTVVWVEFPGPPGPPGMPNGFWDIQPDDSILRIGTVSGTSISWGTEVVVLSPSTYAATGSDRRMGIDPNTTGKFIIIHKSTGQIKIGDCYG